MALFFCGCDVGSMYGKAVVVDEKGTLLGSSIVRSKIDPEETSLLTIDESIKNISEIKHYTDFAYLVGTGYGRNKVPFADENISEISCHALGVFITDPGIRTIIDIGGQDIKGISVDTDGTVASFSMNDKCAAGTGRFFENMAATFELSLSEFSDLSLKAKSVVPITSQCSVFAESEVISLVAEKNAREDIAAGIQLSVAKRCLTMLRRAGIKPDITMTGGCAKNIGLKKALEEVLKTRIVVLKTDPQLMGALGAAEFARKKGMVKKGE
ncbi:acyl-CoA dehydratase activase [candidate division CSSED10-310 bacterium]|uniref:Acyl-CoA dehydratase activase n=1 Tax=candidate division CSSED10-310 bacterium TaxID=2855610 RepID=A0ABV6YUF0_UNCC1